jgi:hypothetical protein
MYNAPYLRVEVEASILAICGCCKVSKLVYSYNRYWWGYVYNGAE